MRANQPGSEHAVALPALQPHEVPAPRWITPLNADAIQGRNDPADLAARLGGWDDFETGITQGSDRPDAAVRFPRVGSDFLGFELIAELGRGSFGRVYLGRQDALADRLVALKVSTEILAESQKLAQLQHTYIMPIYSLHQAGLLQAVCMPFFGSTTFADVLRDLGRRDSMPASGKGLISTLEDRKSRTRATLERGDSAPGQPDRAQRASPNKITPMPARLRSDGTEAAPSLRHLEGLTYVEAVLWIGACLADGLHHAHERGIIHRDLKPANILLTDDGQPMLLDFNLAADLKAMRPEEESGGVGGTLPYMAPEHLAAFAGLPAPRGAGEKPQVDARSDIYSLGVILCELLTGKHPFPRHHAPVDVLVPRMMAERLDTRPAIRVHNPSISPAIKAILHKCLEPNPARRYPTALALQEDLHCQLRHEPLRHVPEPSWGERLHKWSRRHPRLASSSTVLAFASVLLLALSLALVARSRHLTRLEAQAQHNAFQEELHSARLLLASRLEEEPQREEGRILAQRALDRYGVLGAADWRDGKAVRALPGSKQDELAAEIGEMLLLLADTAPPHDALTLNTRALVCFNDQAPRSLWQQRADLYDKLGRNVDATIARQRAIAALADTAQDYFVEAASQQKKGNYTQAIASLHKAVALDPRHFAAWYLLGNCYLDGYTEPQGRESEAVGYFTTCIALRPRFAGAWYGRGLAHLRLRQYQLAETDFTTTLQLRPTLTSALVNRAKVYEERKKYLAAIADLDKALTQDGPKTRLLLLRSRFRERLGEAAGARQDRTEALRLEPTDEESYIARGMARVARDARGALADFAQAVKINPRSLPGLLNQAQVLAERMGKTNEGIALLDRLLLLYPETVVARSSRGVLLARLADYTKALADARKSLEQAGSMPAIQFQVAGIYALCSRNDAKHRDESIRLLTLPLKGRYGYDIIDRDDDLKPIHLDARYRALLQAARTLRSSIKDPTKAPAPGES